MSEDETKPIEYVEVLRLADPAALAVITTLLEGSTMRFEIFDAVSSVFGEAGAARVMVDREQLEEARDLLQEFL